MSRVEIEVTPDPSDEERAAILAALELEAAEVLEPPAELAAEQ